MTNDFDYFTKLVSFNECKLYGQLESLIEPIYLLKQSTDNSISKSPTRQKFEIVEESHYAKGSATLFID